MSEKIPFLAGGPSSIGPAKTKLKSGFSFINGYVVPKSAPTNIKVEDLAKELTINPSLTYKDSRKNKTEARFVPAHVAFDKVVLRFDGYFKETIHESREAYHLRKVKILYFLEDDSIAVIEPPVENSGIPQGVLIKRQRLPKNSTSYYGLEDLNVGINITFYAKTFRIVSCDGFTQKYLTEQGVKVNAFEQMPVDEYQAQRNRPLRDSLSKEKDDTLKRFLEYDRKVLRFYGIWDDRASLFGELRSFVIHYYLVDDTIEIRELQKPNCGRDPVPILLKRQNLPKGNTKYLWSDLLLGQTITVYGRPFLIHDSDAFTKHFYAEMGLASNPVSVPEETITPVEHETPPYTGFGTIEDSLGSVKNLVLKPPKKDFIKMFENDGKVLRFAARLDSKYKEDQGRRFIISYYLADDTISIYEPVQRNAGILGGSFKERGQVLLPGSSLADPKGPAYYELKHLKLGATIEANHYKFVLEDADDYALRYLEANPGKFPESNVQLVTSKVKEALKAAPAASVEELKHQLQRVSQNGTVQRSHFVSLVKRVLALSEQELTTFARANEPFPKQVAITSL